MKKIAICMLITTSMFVACGEVKDNVLEAQDEIKQDIGNNDTLADENLEKLNKDDVLKGITALKHELEDSHKDRYGEKNDKSKLIDEAEFEYKTWESNLTKICNSIKLNLSNDDIRVFDREQADWLESINNIPEPNNESGDNESTSKFSHLERLIESTMKRCFYLVENYM